MTTTSSDLDAQASRSERFLEEVSGAPFIAKSADTESRIRSTIEAFSSIP